MTISTNAIISTLAGALTNLTRVDVVQILDQQTMQPIFAAARPLRALVKETAKVSKYPVETGYVVSDNRVSNPTEIDMDFLIQQGGYSTVYLQIRNAWLNGSLLSVQTRTGTYKNMVIESMPHDEDPDVYSSIMMRIRFSEFIIVSSNITNSVIVPNFSPAQPQAQDTVTSGLIQGVAAASSALSYFHAASVVGL